MADRVARHIGPADPGSAARAEASAAEVARVGVRDAVDFGIVGDASAGHLSEVKGGRATRLARVAAVSRSKAGSADPGDAGDDAADNIASVSAAARARAGMRSKALAVAAAEADESDELSGTGTVYETGSNARAAVARVRSGKEQGEPKGKASRNAKKKAEGEKARKSTKKAQQRRTWLRSRETQAKAQAAGAKTAEKAAGKGVAQAIASAASSLLAPLAGVLAGILAFIIGLLLVSQLISSIFGFWENEAYKANMAGLPPYITEEMVLTALECQEKYGHPAGCTIAQIICESGCGDHLSGLATRDKNLFGIKWASSFSLCPEVKGCSDYQTGEYYDGQYVTVTASFTSFKSYSDCIVFRSRVLLQGSRYADNPTIRRAIAECDSDLMAEGLKDAGYATSPSYVESLKSVMDTYGLRRFDGMTVKEYEEQGKDGGIIVKAAYAQLGTPYVWGGTSPYRGLDCSGLTQWCYAQAGISIPKYSEDQHACGTSIPLSQARPGDILWRPGHVAIYIGGDQYIHAPQPGDVVRIGTGIHYFTCAVRY